MEAEGGLAIISRIVSKVECRPFILDQSAPGSTCLYKSLYQSDMREVLLFSDVY